MGHVFLPTPFVTQYRFGDQALRTLLPAFAPCFSKRQPPPQKKKMGSFFFSLGAPNKQCFGRKMESLPGWTCGKWGDVLQAISIEYEPSLERKGAPFETPG